MFMMFPPVILIVCRKTFHFVCALLVEELDVSEDAELSGKLDGLKAGEKIDHTKETS